MCATLTGPSLSPAGCPSNIFMVISVYGLPFALARGESASSSFTTMSGRPLPRPMKFCNWPATLPFPSSTRPRISWMLYVISGLTKYGSKLLIPPQGQCKLFIRMLVHRIWPFKLSHLSYVPSTLPTLPVVSPCC